MKHQKIKVSLRKELGKKATKALRKNKCVPCVLYGGGKNIHFFAEERDFRHIVYTPNVYLVELNIDGEIYNATLKDIQFHPVRDNILHIDFFQIFEGKKITVEIPIKLNGLAEGVKEGGKMQIIRRKLKVKAFAADLPDQLEINVENVKLGRNIKIAELSYDNLEMLDKKTDVVLTVNLTRAAKGAAEDEEEGVEGEGEKETENTKEDK